MISVQRATNPAAPRPLLDEGGARRLFELDNSNRASEKLLRCKTRRASHFEASGSNLLVTNEAYSMNHFFVVRSLHRLSWLSTWCVLASCNAASEGHIESGGAGGALAAGAREGGSISAGAAAQPTQVAAGGVGGLSGAGGSTSNLPPSNAGQSGQAGQGGAIANAAGGSAGSSSAGSAQGGGVTASPSCAGTLVCDDFESYDTEPGGIWKISTHNGTVAIDESRHASGHKAVKFSTTGVAYDQRAYIGIEGAPFPVSGNAFYGRFMIYTTKAPNDGVHWTMIDAEGPVPDKGLFNAQVRYGGQWAQRLMANYDSAGKGSDCWHHSQTKMPEGRWACMQWYFDGGSNTQKFWLDSQPIVDLTVVGKGSDPSDNCVAIDPGVSTEGNWYFPRDFERAYVGWESYQKDDAREVWIDDIALSLSPIACP